MKYRFGEKAKFIHSMYVTFKNLQTSRNSHYLPKFDEFSVQIFGLGNRRLSCSCVQTDQLLLLLIISQFALRHDDNDDDDVVSYPSR